MDINHLLERADWDTISAEMYKEEVASLVFGLAGKVTRYLNSPLGPGFKVNSSSEYSLSEQQYHILFCIEYCEADTLTAIAKSLCTSTSALSTVVSKMAAAGILEKKHSQKGRDRRSVIVEITLQGREAFNAHTEKILHCIETFRQKLSKEEFLAFEEASRLVKTAILGPYPPPRGSFSENVFRDYISIRNLIEKHYAKRFPRGRQLGLTQEQFRILVIARDFNISTPGHMANLLSLSESSVSVAIKKLAREGYIRKESGGDDARRLNFYLTKAGEAAVDAIKEKIISDFLDFCGDIQGKPLLRGLQLLNNVFTTLNNRELGALNYKTGGHNQ